MTTCKRICHQINGFDPAGELRDAIGQNGASVVEHLGRITGYTTGIAFFGHNVAETKQDLLALIGAAKRNISARSGQIDDVRVWHEPKCPLVSSRSAIEGRADPARTWHGSD